MIEKLRITTEFIKRKIPDIPDTLIILGSGLTKMAENIPADISIPYKDIPHFKETRVTSHPGKLVCGPISGKRGLILAGRIHAYEGYSMEEITYPVFTAGKLGIKRIIVTCLAGGINKSYKTGDFVVVKDHINFSGINPLVGLDENSFGNRFVDMLDAYSPCLIKLIKTSARKTGTRLREGIFAYLTGPSFETPAELKFLRKSGADLVGWSLVPEVLAARQQGIDVLGLSCISDLSKPETLKPVNLENIFNTGIEKSSELAVLLGDFLNNL